MIGYMINRLKIAIIKRVQCLIKLKCPTKILLIYLMTYEDMFLCCIFRQIYNQFHRLYFFFPRALLKFYNFSLNTS